MYNYYIHEKNQNKLKEESEKQLQIKLDKQNRKKLNKKLANNYEKRIEEFIFNMAAKPLVIKNYHSPVESTRFEFLKEGDPNKKKGFIFKGFQTEKERIKTYLSERKQLISMGLQSKETKGDENRQVQPNMRFKPRTDLERIVEVINDYNYGRASTDAVKKQLKNLDLNVMKRTNEDSDKESNNTPRRYHEEDNGFGFAGSPGRNEEKRDRSKSLVSKYKPKRKKVDNSSAKSLMKEYHFKTHFKASTVVASRYQNAKETNKDEKLNNLRHGLTSMSFGLSNTFYNTTNQKMTNSTRNIHTSLVNDSKKFSSITKRDSVIQHFARKFPLEEENIDIIEANPLLYQINFNSAGRVNEESDFDQQKLNYLKRLSEQKKDDTKKAFGKGNFFTKLKFSKRKTNSQLGANPSGFFRNIGQEEFEEYEKKEEEKVFVNNELIPKSQIDLIARKILLNCNFVHPKSKSNQKSLKKGDGKLMMTSGLSIQEFSKR